MYERALALAPRVDASSSAMIERARVNMDKLPVSEAYRAGAARETRILAHRAALAVLARQRTAAAAGDETSAAVHGGAPLAALNGARLFRTIRYLRRLETEQLAGEHARDMWQGRGLEMPGAMLAASAPRGGGGGGGKEDAPAANFSLQAFAWGGVWYHSAWLRACNARAETRAAISRAVRSGRSAAVLGSSIGFEAHFAALTYGLPTVGVELLCGLVALSERVRVAHGVPRELVRFECADALEWPLPPDLGLVYVDDTAWDAPTVAQMAARLGRELPEGALVVHNGGEEAYGRVRRLRKLQSVAVGTSWSEAHTILVHVVRS